MKAQLNRQSRYSLMGLFTLMFCSLFFISTQAKAHGCHKAYVPVAMCTTSGTNIALPQYVCCQLLHKGRHVWRDTWVAGSCQNANPHAIYDMGCKVHSPVYGTGKPILGDCQFSWSTGKYR